MSGMYKLFQAQILSKDPVNPRQYTVMHIPEGYQLTHVELPSALKDQSAPLLNSIVLVIQIDSYRSYILSVLREPFDVLNTNNQFRGFIPSTNNFSQDVSNGANPIQDGEIFMEATGPQSPNGQVTPGFGAHLFLGNNGSAQIESGSMSERLVIGGTGSDDDHEVLLSADNIFIEGNPNEITLVQSTLNYDSLNNIQLGNVITTPTNITTIPLSELTMDTLGNVTLRNTVSGTGISLASLSMDISGGITLSSSVGGVPQAIVTLNNDKIVNINNGTLGCARISDTVISNTSTDPQYWLFINAIQAFFTALSGFTGGSPVAHSELGALGLAFLAQSPTTPPALISKISTGSSTVLVGN